MLAWDIFSGEGFLMLAAAVLCFLMVCLALDFTAVLA